MATDMDHQHRTDFGYYVLLFYVFLVIFQLFISVNGIVRIMKLTDQQAYGTAHEVASYLVEGFT